MTQNLKGVIPDKAVTVIQQLSTSLSTLVTRFNALSSKPLLTVPDAEAKYGPATMTQALQVSGSNPLNITGLIGQLSQNQLAQIPNFTSIPTSGKYSQPGTLITLNGVLTVVSAPGKGTTAGAVPSGPAGGDLIGAYPDPGVGKVNGGAIPLSAALTGTNASRQVIAATSLVIKGAVGFAYVPVENGANNAIACAAGSGPPLVDGLQVTIKLAHTLRAALGNTFDYLTTGTPWNIVSHFDASSNQVTGYSVGGYITLVANVAATVWLDMSQ